MTVKVKHSELKQQRQLEEDQVEKGEVGNCDEEAVVSFPDFREHNGPVILEVTESEPYDFI